MGVQFWGRWVLRFTLLVVVNTLEARGVKESYQNVERYSILDGLSQSLVQDIVQDNTGYMWFATGNGLSRYDGYEFKVFRREQSNNKTLAGDYIKALLVDNSGILWVGTLGDGLSVYTHDDESFELFNFGLDENGLEIYELFEDTQSRIWVGTNKGLYSISKNRKDIKSHNKALRLDDTIVTTITETKDGSIWLGTNTAELLAVSSITHEQTVYEGSLNGLKGLEITSILPISEDALFVGTSRNGVYTYKSSSNTFVKEHLFDDKFGEVGVMNMLEDSSGDIWLATNGQGLVKYDQKLNLLEKSQSRIGDKNSLSGNRLLTLFEDRTQNLWIGTFSQGVNRVSLKTKSIKTIAYDTLNPVRLSDRTIWSVYEDSQKGMWVGTDVAIDYRAADKTEFNRLNRLGNANHGVDVADATVFLQVENVLWIGTWSKGLIRYDMLTNKAQNYSTASSDERQIVEDKVRVLMFDDQKHELWIGTHKGINILHTMTGTIREYSKQASDPYSIPHNRIRSIYKDDSGRVWVGTSAGLSYYDIEVDGFKREQYPKEWQKRLETSDIRSIYKDADNVFWLATGSGLDRVDFVNRSLTTYRVKDGLSDDVLYSFLPDRQGSYWITTDNGLNQFDAKTETFKSFDINDGLQSNEFNFGAHFLSKEGVLYLGGVNGLSILDLEKIEQKPDLVPLVINRIEAFNSSNDSTSVHFGGYMGNGNQRAITLVPSDKRVEISFAGLEFDQPDSLLYAYRLGNQDKDWIHASADQRRAVYTNLSPGEHQFQLSLLNKLNDRIGEPITVFIQVVPAFWQTLLFKLFAAVMLLVAVFFFIRMRIHVAVKRAELLKLKVSERTLELQQSIESRTLGLNAISHDLGTPIAVIDQMTSMMKSRLSESDSLDIKLQRHFDVLAESLSEADRRVRQLQEVIRTERLSLEAIEKVKVKLKLETVLRAYSEYAERLIVSNIPECEVLCSPSAPSLILDNLISNALKYSEENSQVELLFSINSSNFSIECRDLGVGIPEQEIESVQQFYYRNIQHRNVVKGQGVGLGLVKEILETCKGAIVISDNKPKGTIAKVTLPLASPVT